MTLHIAQKGLKNPDEAGAASVDYLRLFALVVLAFMWVKMVKVAREKLAAGANGEASFYEAKIATARFFMSKILPENSALFAQIMAGADPIMGFEDNAF